LARGATGAMVRGRGDAEEEAERRTAARPDEVVSCGGGVWKSRSGE
jgi:hypothetical protein